LTSLAAKQQTSVTYVITGDVDAMWPRDNSAQVYPYRSLMHDDPQLQQLIAGVINRQTRNVPLSLVPTSHSTGPRATKSEEKFDSFLSCLAS
jgi:hypothetical protein